MFKFWSDHFTMIQIQNVKAKNKQTNKKTKKTKKTIIKKKPIKIILWF